MLSYIDYLKHISRLGNNKPIHLPRSRRTQLLYPYPLSLHARFLSPIVLLGVILSVLQPTMQDNMIHTEPYKIKYLRSICLIKISIHV